MKLSKITGGGWHNSIHSWSFYVMIAINEIGFAGVSKGFRSIYKANCLDYLCRIK